jgi:Glycosyl hydrolases family 16
VQTTDVITPPVYAPQRARHRSRWEARVAIITVLVFGLALSGVVLFALIGPPTPALIMTTATTLPPSAHSILYPIGTPQLNEPSLLGPPPSNALHGFHRVYATDFTGSTLPPGWTPFTGVPGGSGSTTKFAASHVAVTGGMLRLATFHDPRYPGFKWTSGGLCQCGHPMTYGAFFVRSRISNAGPNEIELLWPANNQWPPEIDFNESGTRWAATSSTLHHGTPTNDLRIQQNLAGIDLRRWHTWGVVWTPHAITFTVDGQQWGYSINGPGTVPKLAMTLDFEQRPGCVPGLACPSQNQTMLVDWVAEYAPNAR